MNRRFPSLNLPVADLNIKNQDGRLMVMDSLRRKFVALTPEEYVRQSFTAFLADTLGYPRGLMANEVSLTLNGMNRRCDTLISDRKAQPLMIVEYKAPDVVITQDVFDQIARYNMVIGATYLTVSNGMHHYCCRYSDSDGKYCFLPSIPTFQSIETDTSEITKN